MAAAVAAAAAAADCRHPARRRIKSSTQSHVLATSFSLVAGLSCLMWQAAGGRAFPIIKPTLSGLPSSSALRLVLNMASEAEWRWLPGRQSQGGGLLGRRLNARTAPTLSTQQCELEGDVKIGTADARFNVPDTDIHLAVAATARPAAGVPILDM